MLCECAIAGELMKQLLCIGKDGLESWWHGSGVAALGRKHRTGNNVINIVRE